ncbi:MAG: ATP-binding protein [Candidatus Saccharimonas sp.]
MNTGGPQELNQRTKDVIRAAGLFVPLLLVLYGVLIQFDATEHSRYMGNTAFWVISICWFGLAVFQYLVPPASRTQSLLRLAAYHTLAAAYLLMVASFASPLTMIWVILMLAAFAYNGRDGLYMSVVILIATGVCDTLLAVDMTGDSAQNALYALVTLLVGFVALRINTSDDVDRNALAKSRAEEQLQRDRVMTIVNNLADAILSTDSEGVIQLYNAASLSLLDTNTGLQGQHIDDIIHLYDSDNHSFKLSHMFKSLRGVKTREDLRATISDEVIRIGIVYSPIRSTDSSSDTESDGFIVILRDITKQKSLEEERDEFISVVSHELRTPITIAEGTISNAQVMLSRSDITKVKLSESIDVAHEQVVFLAKMVNDLSTLSRAERGVADTPEDIDVTAMIQELYTEYAPEAQAKGLTFDLDLSPKLGHVTASPLYLKELLQNFVTNAIKYTKEGGVTVVIKRTPKKLSFSIKDTGIGMSKSDQAHVFEKFWRSEDYRTRETGGTGLGLYVSAKLSKKLGTKIEMSSRLNHGSTFSFSLPAESK